MKLHFEEASRFFRRGALAYGSKCPDKMRFESRTWDSGIPLSGMFPGHIFFVQVVETSCSGNSSVSCRTLISLHGELVDDDQCNGPHSSFGLRSRLKSFVVDVLFLASAFCLEPVVSVSTPSNVVCEPRNYSFGAKRTCLALRGVVL